jgi:hypothetical protein
MTNQTSSKAKETKAESSSNNLPIAPFDPGSVKLYSIIASIGLLVSLSLVYYYLHSIQGKVNDTTDERIFYLILILFGISVSALVFGVLKTYATLTGTVQHTTLNMTGPGVGIVLVVLGGFYLPTKELNHIVTIRVFDQKKKPLTQGNIKIYLNDYIRTQSIDNVGQALFTGLPAEMLQNKLKIELSSPGYNTKTYDTVLTSSKAMNFTLALSEVIIISGRVKTAAEMPIKDVEVNVDGTRYYAKTATDGTYTLRLQEYTIGDEISITTSNENYEDKTLPLKLLTPEMKDQDIFLNPIAH